MPAWVYPVHVAVTSIKELTCLHVVTVYLFLKILQCQKRMALKMLAVSLLLSAILAVTVSSPSKPNNRLDALIQELLTYEQG